jgi:hypothetical protein
MLVPACCRGGKGSAGPKYNRDGAACSDQTMLVDRADWLRIVTTVGEFPGCGKVKGGCFAEIGNLS